MIFVAKQLLSEERMLSMRTKLTVNMPIYGHRDKFSTRRLYCETETQCAVPKYFAHAEWKMLTKEEGVFPEMSPTCVYVGKLLNTAYQPQVEAVASAVGQLKAINGALIVAPPGVGKTDMALAVANELRLKVIVLVADTDLINQWIVRIQARFPDSRVGKIQRKECDSVGCDFVVASVKSFKTREYGDDALTCGLLIVDECHHCACQQYMHALSRIHYKYSLGLTGTLKRSDGCVHMVEWLLGPKCCDIKLPINASVQVNMIDFTMGRNKEIRNKNGDLCLSTMVTALTKEPIRNRLLLSVIRLMHTKYPTRKGLLLSDRVEHLKQLYRDIDDPSMCAIISGAIHTDMTTQERALRKRKREEIKFEKFLTLSTYLKFQEAVDFDGDFIILATPKPHVEQPTGRIMRGRKKEHSPAIFDIVDNFSVFDQWKWSRSQFYKTRGYKVISLTEKKIFAVVKPA
jgi:superfamily II DNA or RNA helicase